jgi:GH25 family lysozyme M1 (1,4-beta-N-acetylmuramidase)
MWLPFRIASCSESPRLLTKASDGRQDATCPPVSRQDIEGLNRKMDELATRIEELAGKKPAKKQAA